VQCPATAKLTKLAQTFCTVASINRSSTDCLSAANSNTADISVRPSNATLSCRLLSGRLKPACRPFSLLSSPEGWPGPLLLPLPPPALPFPPLSVRLAAGELLPFAPLLRLLSVLPVLPLPVEPEEAFVIKLPLHLLLMSGTAAADTGFAHDLEGPNLGSLASPSTTGTTLLLAAACSLGCDNNS
jgi:hypothetical protein